MEIIFLLVLVGAMYALMIAPQQRRVKAHRAVLRKLEAGDVVVTNSGIHGAIAEVDGDIVWLEVAPEVELKLTKSAIAEVIQEDDSDDDADDAADDAADELAELDE